MAERKLFTSESVADGHPDKVADQISDAILDAHIAGDPYSRVACETLVTTDLCVIAGEITSKKEVDYIGVAKNVISRIGYTDPKLGFSAESARFVLAVHKQSPDIARGVDERKGHEQGAGDQGLMFGYACRETDAFMPLPIYLAHRITERLKEARESGEIKYLMPDGKSQVTVEYEGRRPLRVVAVVCSAQHSHEIDDAAMEKKLRPEILEKVILPCIPEDMLDRKTCKFYINPTGRFEVGGPAGDTGVTGRKIIVDTYGGKGSHGGGCFSGKDPSKVDRSATYMARHIAKNVVAAGLADECEVQLAYAIGVAEPVSVLVDTNGTGKASDEAIATAVREIFPLKPRQIIEYLKLRRPIFEKTARFGHFGRKDKDFTWEKTGRAAELKKLCKAG